jgi:hypothetical protein
MWRTFVSSLVVVWLAVGLSTVANALSFHSALDPIKIDGRPGQVVTREFHLTLTANEQRTHFKARVEDWWRSEDGSQSFYREPGAPGTPTRSCARWVRLNPVESVVEPGGTLGIRVTTAIPADVKPGGYWSVLTVDEVPDPLVVVLGIGMRCVASVSVGIFVYIQPLQRIVRITDVQILPEQANVKVQNEGNTPLGVEGRIEFVRTGENQPAATAKICRETVLPEPINTQILVTKMPEPAALPSGRYMVRVILDIGLDHYIGVQKEMDIKREAALSPAGK